MFARLFNRGKEDKEKYNQLPIPEDANWSFLGADMHSHFVPGIDDGAKTIEGSIVLLRAMADMGFKTVVTTPHIMLDYYPNNREIIEKGLEKLHTAVKENNIELTVRAAAEYYIDESFVKLIDTVPLLTVHKNEVLVEFSMLFEPPMLAETLFKMQGAGYRPILAHPERYGFFHHNFERYRDMKDRGCLLQLNLLSLTGYYGKNVKMAAEMLLEKGMYDYCGSDMHHDKHAAALKTMTQTPLYTLLVNYPFLNSKLCF